MGGNLVETLIGAVVLAVAGLFLFFAYSTTDVGTVEGYEVTARFDRVDGLAVGSDVRMSGIKVGTVVDQKLDKTSFLAVVRMTLDSSVQLPEDSSAKIASEGLLGGNYLALEPGGAEENIAPGGEIKYTQGSIDLVNLLGQAIFNAGGSDAKPAQ